MACFPAITIWQPWASLIIAGAKPYEFRGWPAPRDVRGRRIAIHAGARKVVLAELRALRLRLRDPANTTGLKAEIAIPLLERWCQDPSSLPLGCVLCTAMLGEPLLANRLPEFAGAFTNDSDREEHAAWAWPLSEIKPLEPPEPASGKQGFWTWRAPSLELGDGRYSTRKGS